MPVTDSEVVNVFGRRVLGFVDFRDRILDVALSSVLRHTKTLTTGPAPLGTSDPGGWFDSITPQDGGGVNDLTFVGGAGGLYGTDGTGELLSVLNADPRITAVPFPDTAATTFYLASRTCEVPEGVVVDTQTGARQYDYTRREIGHAAEPTAAAPSGLGIALTLGNHKLDAADDFTGRTAIVWLNTPVSGSPAVAIETVTIVGTTATTTGALGQSVISTDPTDYMVAIVGPTITRHALSAADAGWAFIGTVVGGGSPRAFSVSGQVQLASLQDLATYANRTQARGWLGTVPTVTNTLTTVSITTTGQLVVNGRLRNTPTAGPIGSLPASSDVWVCWDDATSSFQKFTTWDTAFAVGRVPLVWFKTNGSSQIGNLVRIGRLIEEYPETLTITVATDPSARAEFQSLRNALAAARSYQKGATLAPRAIVIELIGDVTVSAAITETELFETESITIRGRGGRWDGGGSRLIWTHLTGGLFVLNNAAIALKNWAFEDVTFRCAGTMTDAKAGVFSVRAATSLALQFRRCVVDGSTLLVPSGGAGGTLPCFIYAEDGQLGLSVDDCTILTTDALINATAATDGIQGLTMRATTWVQFGTAVGATLGGLLDFSTGARDWKIIECEFTSIGGPCVWFDKLDQGRFRGCLFATSGADIGAVQFGESSYAGVNNIWLTGCQISSVWGGGASSTAVVRVRAGNNAGLPPGIFIFDNMISGDGDTTTAIGISLGTNATDLDGVQVHNNTITKVGTGIRCVTVGGMTTSPIIGQNFIVAGSTGMLIQAIDDPVVIGNFVNITQAAGIGYDVNNTALLVGNQMQTAQATAVGIDIDADGCIIVGNRIDQDITITGNSNVIAANIELDALAISGSSAKNILAANGVAGTTDLTTADQTILVGDYLVGAITVPGSTHGDVIFDGVYIENTNNIDLVHDRGTMSGCIVKATNFSLNVSTSDLAVVGNHFSDTTPTDSGGTGNVLANNT